MCETQQVALALSSYRKYALLHLSGRQFHGSNLQSQASSYKKDSLGCDNWAPSEIAALPIECLNLLADALSHGFDRVAAPHQNLMSLNPCLGKPSGDCRTICKTPMLYRLFLRDNVSVREWEISHKKPYDTASIGSSALIAALLRNLQMEVATLLNMCCATILNDYQKFF